MPPPYRTIVKGANPLVGPRVRIKGIPGQEGYDAILRDYAEEPGGRVATVWGGRKGCEAWRTVAAERVVVRRG